MAAGTSEIHCTQLKTRPQHLCPPHVTEYVQTPLPPDGSFCEARNKYFLEATAWHLFGISQQGVGLSLTGQGPSPEDCVSSPGVDVVPGHLRGPLRACPDPARLRQRWPSPFSWHLGDRWAAGRSCLPLQLCPEVGPPPAHGFPRAGPLPTAMEPRELQGGPAPAASPGGACCPHRELPRVRPSVFPVVRRPPRDCTALPPGPGLHTCVCLERALPIPRVAFPGDEGSKTGTGLFPPCTAAQPAEVGSGVPLALPGLSFICNVVSHALPSGITELVA